MRIIKNGLLNEVDEETFKKRYEPKGWKRFNEAPREESIEQQAIKEKDGESKIIELNDNKKRSSAKKFNDKIIKE